MHNCSLCVEFNDKESGRIPDIKQYFTDSRIFACNRELCVFPTLGCFVKGYLLLSTLDHYISLCNCPDAIVEKIEQAIGRIGAAFAEKMQSGYVFFEHGTVSDFGLSAASVCHFHMHFLPMDRPIWQELCEKYHFAYDQLDSLVQVKEIIAARGITSYLLFGDQDGQIYLINCPPKQYPSQFLRKVMYEFYFGDTEQEAWDWKKNPCYDLMAETIEVMKGLTI